MKIESYLPVFPGFYNTIFQADEEGYIEEGKTYDDYNWDYQEYERRVAVACVGFIEKELRHLCMEMNIEFQNVSSPREYNFANDAIHVEYDVNTTVLNDIRKYLQTNFEEFAEFIKSRYTSCDGFISSHSNNAHDWVNDLNELEDLGHKFGAILEFIFQNEFEDAEEDMYYDVQESMWIEGELIENEEE